MPIFYMCKFFGSYYFLEQNLGAIFFIWKYFDVPHTLQEDIYLRYEEQQHNTFSFVFVLLIKFSYFNPKIPLVSVVPDLIYFLEKLIISYDTRRYR